MQPGVRRLFIALFALVALGAAAPSADVPTVVVYPMQASAALSRDVMLQIVTALANEIASADASMSCRPIPTWNGSTT
jgi:hypothetical protein